MHNNINTLNYKTPKRSLGLSAPQVRTGHCGAAWDCAFAWDLQPNEMTLQTWRQTWFLWSIIGCLNSVSQRLLWLDCIYWVGNLIHVTFNIELSECMINFCRSDIGLIIRFTESSNVIIKQLFLVIFCPGYFSAKSFCLGNNTWHYQKQVASWWAICSDNCIFIVDCSP